MIKRHCDTCKGIEGFYKPWYLSFKSNLRKCNGCNKKLNIKVYLNK